MNNMFEHTNSADFLRFLYQEKQDLNPRFSIRSWSRQIGIDSGTLSRLIQGKRRLSIAQATLISDKMNLSEANRNQLELLTLHENAKSKFEQDLYQKLIAQYSVRSKTKFLSVDEFQVISRWYHIAILEMTQLKDFQYDPRWISKRLNGAATENQIMTAIGRLMRMGLIAKGDDGKLNRVDDSYIKFGDQCPSEAVRSYHSQMFQIAHDSVTEQKFGERALQSSTISLTKENFEEAKKLTKEFHASISALGAQSNGDELYHCIMNIFPLTKSGGSSVSHN